MDTRFRLSLLLLAAAVILSLTTCTAFKVAPAKKDNGKHKGWYKNPNNPHHPASTNPGHTKSKPASSGSVKNNAKTKK